MIPDMDPQIVMLTLQHLEAEHPKVFWEIIEMTITSAAKYGTHDDRESLTQIVKNILVAKSQSHHPKEDLDTKSRGGTLINFFNIFYSAVKKRQDESAAALESPEGLRQARVLMEEPPLSTPPSAADLTPLSLTPPPPLLPVPAPPVMMAPPVHPAQPPQGAHIGRNAIRKHMLGTGTAPRIAGIDMISLMRHYPDAKRSSDSRIQLIYTLAVRCFALIRVVDAIMSTLRSDRKGSLSGTGAFGTSSSALKKGYKTLFVTVHACITDSKFSIEESVIIAVGLFLHVCDVFYLIAKFYRGLQQMPPSISDSASPEEKAAYADAVAIYQERVIRVRELTAVHNEAFRLVIAYPERTGCKSSFDPRFRAIGMDMPHPLHLPDGTTRGPFASSMVTTSVKLSWFSAQVYRGTLTERSTLCTGTDAHGCYTAFSATAGYDVSTHGYILMVLCSTCTYELATISPFPQEMEWVVPPGSEYETILFEHPRENFVDFITRLIAHLPPEIAAGLRKLLEQYSSSVAASGGAPDPAFRSIRYICIMYPRTLTISLPS